MKKLLPVLPLLLCFNSFLLAQGFNYAYADGQSSLAGGIAINENGQWLIAGYRGGYGAKPYLGTNLDGSNTFLDVDYFALGDDFDFDGSLMNISNMVYDSLSSIFYMAVGRDHCDVGLPDKILKLEVSGEEVFPYLPLVIPGDNFAVNYKLGTVPGQGLLIGVNDEYGADRVIYERNSSFWTLMYLNSEYPIQNISHWYDDRFVLQTESSLILASFTEADNGGEILQETTVEQGVTIAPLNENRLLVLSMTSLEVMDENLSLLLELPFSNATQLTIDDNYIYVIDAEGIHFLNDEFEEQVVVELEEVNDYTILNIAARDGRIGVTGASAVSSNYGYYSLKKATSHLFAKSYTIDGADFPATTDLAITDLVIGPPNVTISPYEPSCMTAYVNDIEVTIKNEGSTTVSEVVFASARNGCDPDGIICPLWESDYWPPLEVNLAPGTSVTLNLDPLILGSIAQSTNVNLCLTVFAAEGSTEVNLSDNRMCSSSVMVVDTEEVAALAPLKVYPTTCQDQLTLSLPTNSKGFESVVIYNLLGQALMRYDLPAGLSDIPVSVAALSSGSYYLRLEGKGLSQSVVFVKQ